LATSILVPLDESRWSRHALGNALDLAAASPHEVVVHCLHVVNVTRLRGRWLADLAGLMGAEPLVVPERVEAHFKARGEALLESARVRAMAAGVPFRGTLDQGAVVDRIVHRAAAHDLVLMGVRGETEEQFPGQGGGTADRVLRRLPVDVLLVPSEGPIRGDVAVGFDGSNGSVLAMRSAARLAGHLGASVLVMHVGEGDDTNAPLVEARRLADELGINARFLQLDGEPGEALPAGATQAGCRTLALGYRGRSQLKDVFLGRTTEWLLGSVDLALLVAR
jgi:nucleotide-binding universal stress UspA family protein